MGRLAIDGTVIAFHEGIVKTLKKIDTVDPIGTAANCATPVSF